MSIGINKFHFIFFIGIFTFLSMIGMPDISFARDGRDRGRYKEHSWKDNRFDRKYDRYKHRRGYHYRDRAYRHSHRHYYYNSYPYRYYYYSPYPYGYYYYGSYPYYYDDNFYHRRGGIRIRLF